MAILGPGLLNVILSLGVLSAANSSRIIQRCPVRQGKPVCRGGTGGGRQPSAHHLWYILPNVMATIIIIATVSLGFAILAESA